MHLYRYRQVLGVCQDCTARWRTGLQDQEPDFCISVDGFQLNFMHRRLLKNACTDLREMLRVVIRCNKMS